jgi:hypothetical protein
MKYEWYHILEVPQCKYPPLDVATFHRRSIMSNPQKTCHKDMIENYWFYMPSAHRICDKWRDDGLLLPFGYKTN